MKLCRSVQIFAGCNFRESFDLGLFAFLFSRVATYFLFSISGGGGGLCVMNGDGMQGTIVYSRDNAINEI